MKRRPIVRFCLGTCLALLAGLAAAEVPTPDRVLADAKAAAHEIPGQARALALLAWPEGGRARADVQAAARQELIYFGKFGMEALREALLRVDPIYHADVTAALIDARRHERVLSPPEFLPGLDDAIWHGSVEAKRLGMMEISRFLFPPALLPIIDALYEYPELGKTGIAALHRMRDPRSRFFLSRILERGEPELRAPAAAALAALGEAGEFVLRNAAESSSAPVRQAAVEALLPVAVTDDLALLYEYLGTHTEDEPSLLDLIRQRAMDLEVQLEQEQLAVTAEDDS